MIEFLTIFVAAALVALLLVTLIHEGRARAQARRSRRLLLGLRDRL